MLPPSNDNKTTYTVSLGWLSNPVVIICSFWLLLIIKLHTRRKKYQKFLPIFLVQQSFSVLTLAVKRKLVVLQMLLEQQINSKVIDTSWFWTLQRLRTDPKKISLPDELVLVRNKLIDCDSDCREKTLAVLETDIFRM